MLSKIPHLVQQAFCMAIFSCKKFPKCCSFDILIATHVCSSESGDPLSPVNSDEEKVI